MQAWEVSKLRQAPSVMKAPSAAMAISLYLPIIFKMMLLAVIRAIGLKMWRTKMNLAQEMLAEI